METVENTAILVLVRSNPKRKGSASAKRFAKYRSGMTQAQAIAAGVTRKDMQWDSARGFIDFKPTNSKRRTH